jgi:hypothetical protein
MKAAPYEELAAALDMLPNGFPRTKGGAEILILKKILTPEEASLASLLTGTFEPTAAIAGRIGVSEAEARKRLFDLAKKGLVWEDKKNLIVLCCLFYNRGCWVEKRGISSRSAVCMMGINYRRRKI